MKRNRRNKAEGAEAPATSRDRLSLMRGGQRRKYFTEIPTSGNDKLSLSGRDLTNWGIIE